MISWGRSWDPSFQIKKRLEIPNAIDWPRAKEPGFVSAAKPSIISRGSVSSMIIIFKVISITSTLGSAVGYPPTVPVLGCVYSSGYKCT